MPVNDILEPIKIPSKTLARHAMGHAWGCGNNIAVFPSVFGYPSSNVQSGDIANVYSLRWDTTVFNPQVRKLVNESCTTFKAVQNQGVDDSKSNLAELSKLSRQYRSIISACIDDLNQTADACVAEAAATEKVPEKARELQQLSEIHYKTELVWNLCEVMYLEKPIGILPHLLEWVRAHFPSAVEMANEVIKSSRPALHEDYWNAIYGLVFQLQVDSALKLLRTHPDFQSESFQSAVELLKKLPIYGMASTVSVPEFTFRWNHWRDECVRRIQAGDFYDMKELETLVQIFCGKEEVFLRLDALFETWYQRMVSELIFTQPTISAGALADEAERAMTIFRRHEQATSLDSTLLAILRRDTRKVIGEMQAVLDNSWFSAHLADLLYHAGALHSFEDVNSSQLRETLLRDYALCLMSHQSLWSVAVLYLDSCPTQGIATLEAVLPRLACQSEYKLAKILAVAERRRLPGVVASVCRVAGRRALNNGRLGAAVAWAVRAQDSALATHAADAVLRTYLDTLDFSATDLLDSLGAGLLASDRLAFLGKYREFHRLYARNEFRPAAALLITLISSRIAPKYFWSVLLMDALPLLETNPTVFTVDETYELMQSLQELTSSFQDDAEASSTPHANCDLNADKTMLITLALSRNLAKCFVQQSVAI